MRTLCRTGLLIIGVLSGFEAACVESSYQPASPDVVRRELEVSIPEAHLIRDDGQRIKASDLLSGRQATVLAFLYTSCTSSCPLTVRTLLKSHKELRARGINVQTVAISIDPQTDTVNTLKQFSKKVGATDGLHFYTGKEDEIIAVEQAFKVYRGDKMNHLNAYMVRKDMNHPWVWIAGSWIGPEKIIGEWNP